MHHSTLALDRASMGCSRNFTNLEHADLQKVVLLHLTTNDQYWAVGRIWSDGSVSRLGGGGIPAQTCTPFTSIAICPKLWVN